MRSYYIVLTLLHYTNYIILNIILSLLHIVLPYTNVFVCGADLTILLLLFTEVKQEHIQTKPKLQVDRF